MSTGFLLIETVPGREGHVLDLLGKVPGVTHRHVLFPANIAVKIEADGEGFDPAALQLKRLEGVVATRLYRAKLT